MFILVFRPHQRPAWATHYDCESDFVDAFLNDNFARSCNAECTGDDLDALSACETDDDKYQVAFERVGHDLSALTRLDSAEEVGRYFIENDYCGRHNKGHEAVEREAREIGWGCEESEVVE